MYAHKHLSGYIDINDSYNEYLLNKSSSQKDILIKSVNKTIKFNGKTSSYPVMISYALWELSKVCRYYKDDYGQFTFLVKACVSSFNIRRESYQIEFMFSEFEYFYNEFNVPSVFIDDLKMVLANNNEYLTNLPNLVESIVKNFKGVHYFTSKEILQIITSSLEMNDEVLMSVYGKVYVRKGGKIQPKKNTALKEIANQQQSETNVISKFFNIFKR